MKDNATQQFLHLLMLNQKRIFVFILSVVPHHADAEDIMQEATQVMWHKFREFNPDLDFASWGIGIAYYELLKFRRRYHRNQRILSEEAIQVLYADPDMARETFDERIDVLQSCVRKLKPSDFQLVQQRYEQDATIKTMAERMGNTVQAVYKRMARIHQTLLSCVERSLCERGLL